jgi:glycosyltransferase involved in cell wall biosynthesis
MLNTARQWAYRQATRVIVTSRAIEQEAQNFGFPASSLARIPNAIDMTRFLPANDEERAKLRKQLSLPEGEAIVVWVGRLVLRKGLETMIEAWSELVRHRPRTLLLVVGAGSGAGHIHDAEENLRAAVVERRLEACVKLVGAVQDVERYLRASDLFAFTSESEGFGVALVEAMACGLPVITSRIEGAAADLIDDGKEGLKYDVGNALQLHQCLTTMLSNPELRRQMGNAGHARVKSTLDVESVANSYELLFKSVLADSKN